MRRASDPEVPEITQRLIGAGRVDVSSASQSAKGLSHLEVDDVWRTEDLTRPREARFYAGMRANREDVVESGGRVEDE